MEKGLEGAFIPPPLLPPWIVEERSDEATPGATVARPTALALGERGYSFTQAPFAFDDFTAASMKARPLTPSSMVGKCTPLGGFLPDARGFDRVRDLAVDVGEAFEIALGMAGRNARHPRRRRRRNPGRRG